MSFPRTDADILARIAVFEFVLDQGDGQENSVTLEERYYAPPSVCCENAKTTSGILSALTACANGFYRSLKMVNVPEHNQEPLLYFEQ